MMKKHFLFLMMTSFLFFSCAKPEKTETSFKLDTRGLYQEMVAMDGKVMKVVLFGKSGPYYFSHVLSDSTSFQKYIPNGVWDFYVLAWMQPETGVGSGVDSAPENDFEGVIHCAIQNGENLAGGQVDINLELNNSDCLLFPGSEIDTGSVVSFKNLEFDFCNQAGFEEIVGATSECKNTSSSTISIKRGHARSFRVKINSVDNFSGALKKVNEASLKSKCIEVQENEKNTIGNPILPFGENIASSNYPVFYEMVQYFGDTDCSSSFKKNIFLFSDDAETLNARVEESSIKNTIFLKSTLQDLCQSRVLEIATQIVGNGSIGWPAVYCTGKSSLWDTGDLIPASVNYIVYPLDLSESSCESGSDPVYTYAGKDYSCVKTYTTP